MKDKIILNFQNVRNSRIEITGIENAKDIEKNFFTVY